MSGPAKIVLPTMSSLATRRLVKITVTIQIATLLLSYLSWVLDGCDPFIPFISDTDTNPASSWAFTIGLTLTGVLMVPLALQFFHMRRKWGDRNKGSGIEKMNLIATISAIISAIATIWISYTPWHQQMELHMIQARVIFGGLMIWAILSTVIAHRMKEADVRFSPLFLNRKNWTIFSLICLIGLAISVFSYAGVSLAIPEGHMDTVLECSDLGHPSLSIAAFFEWLMVLGLAGVSYTGVQETHLLDE